MKRVSYHSRAFVRGFICISIILFGLGLLPIINTNSAISFHDLKASFSLTPHDPIYITSDSGFAVFPGSGTEEDPYLIDGYNITTTSTGISITDTTKHFVIRNCYVETNYIGIYITDVADGTATVANNTAAIATVVSCLSLLIVQRLPTIRAITTGLASGVIILIVLMSLTTRATITDWKVSC